jgi:hypothetical protein
LTQLFFTTFFVAIPLVGDALLEITNQLIEKAGFKPATGDNLRNQETLQSEAQELLTNYFELNTGVSVEVQILETDITINKYQDINFFETFNLKDGSTKILIRVSADTLNRIEASSKFLAEQALSKGVILSQNEAVKLARHMFLVHELAESILGISDFDLTKINIADQARLEASANRFGGLVLQHTYFSAADMIAEIRNIPNASLKKSIGRLKDSKALTDATVQRQNALKALENLPAVSGLIRNLYGIPLAQLNYTLGLPSDTSVTIDRTSAGLSIRRSGLQALSQSTVEQSRWHNIAEIHRQKAKVKPTGEVIEAARSKSGVVYSKELMIFDDPQNGGMKEFFDAYSAHTSKVASGEAFGAFVGGVFQTKAEFESSMQAYQNFLQKSGLTIEAAMLEQFRLYELNDESKITVLYLANDSEKPTKLTTGESFDATIAVKAIHEAYFQLKGFAPQHTILLSNWRHLQVDKAILESIITMIFTMPMTTTTIDNKIKLDSWAAIQA